MSARLLAVMKKIMPGANMRPITPASRAGVFVVLVCLLCWCLSRIALALWCGVYLVSVVGVGLSRRCGVRPIGICRVLRWTLCPEKRNMSIE